MDQILTQPTEVIGQTLLGALLLLSLYANRFLYLELKEQRKAYDEKIEKLNDARMTDMRSVDRLAESVENLGDKFIDLAADRRRV